MTSPGPGHHRPLLAPTMVPATALAPLATTGATEATEATEAIEATEATGTTGTDVIRLAARCAIRPTAG